MLLKYLCACIIHTAFSWSYEHITATKWDCGIISLHCLSPRDCAVLWKLPSRAQTCQEWTFESREVISCIGNTHQSLLGHNINSFSLYYLQPNWITTFVEFPKKIFRHHCKSEQMRAVAPWIKDRCPLGRRGSALLSPITVVSQTGAIIHHKAT